MLIPVFLLLAGVAAADSSPQGNGVIGGVVVNASDEKPAAGVEVVLRVRVEDEFLPWEKTTADAQGKFMFRKLPVGDQYDYLPGANLGGIHYPGPHVRLSRQRPVAGIRLAVRDTVTYPNPLRARRHEILIRPESGAVKVTETIVVENPDSRCYVGQARDDKTEPVTLQLSIPADFLRVTFDQEFFGRRFSLAGGKLVTSIPWTPGQRELKFSYVLANSHGHFRLERPLDLPCSDLRVAVESQSPEEVVCNLGGKPLREGGSVVFESADRTLPAGEVVSVEVGHLPVPFMAYARWIAAAVLAALIGGASVLAARRRRRAEACAKAHHRPRSAKRRDSNASTSRIGRL